MDNIYDFQIVDISGRQVDFSLFKNKTLLIVNTASKCGFTHQYEGLESLYQKYKDQGFEVLGFPCNQFGAQESGSEEEILNFCTMNFNVTFPLFSKVEVNGKGAHPLFTHLKTKAPGLLGSKNIKWNFTKFLVSPDGQEVTRFAPTVKPAEIEKSLQGLLS